jgi:hypothetical protein
MTYDEVFEWVEGIFDIDNYDNDDLGEAYEMITNEWEGRNNFESIISLDEFLNHYESS